MSLISLFSLIIQSESANFKDACVTFSMSDTHPYPRYINDRTLVQ